MTGEQLIKALTERGGSNSGYPDVICGRVINVSPLRVQISSSMIIDDNFITLGRHIGSFPISGSSTTTEEKRGKSGEKPKTEKTTKLTTFTFDNPLKVDDRVTMIRADSGRQFYLFKREDDQFE